MTALVPYADGILTALATSNGAHFEVRWSPDGHNLGEGKVVDSGSSPITAMTPYDNGVLTAYENVEGRNDLSRLHWSQPVNVPHNGDGCHANLGGGDKCYEGTSPILSLAHYNGGFLASFANAGGNSERHSVLFNPNLREWTEYENGTSPVTAMLEFDGGVLAAFATIPRPSGPTPTRYRVVICAPGGRVYQEIEVPASSEAEARQRAMATLRFVQRVHPDARVCRVTPL